MLLLLNCAKTTIINDFKPICAQIKNGGFVVTLKERANLSRDSKDNVDLIDASCNKSPEEIEKILREVKKI